MKKSLVLYLVIFCTSATLAQISPPGLGNTHTAFWEAIGVKQDISDKTTSLTYIGMGRISGIEGVDPFRKESIAVINQEIYHRLNLHWKYSYALSYRRQDQYSSHIPYNIESPAIKQEFRLYSRIAWSSAGEHTKYSITLRQELREFFTPDFDVEDNGTQLRTRLKTGVTIPLSNNKESVITGTAEALFSISNDHANGWNKFKYNESRFCLYYTYSPKAYPVTLDIGYMNNLIGYGNNLADASYIAMDLIINNPF